VAVPPSHASASYRIVPAECVYGVIEVKSSLDAEQLKKARKLIADVKKLPKTAYWPNPKSACAGWMYEQRWPPTVGMVFAYDGINLDSLCEPFEELADQYPPEQCVDSVWVLNKGYINWCNSDTGMLEPDRKPGFGYKAIEATAQEMLMPLTARLHQHFGTAWLPDFNIVDYLMDVPWGTVIRERLEVQNTRRKNPSV
jgi:hypothetical protein